MDEKERLALKITEKDEGLRMDVFLSQNLSQMSRSHVQKLIEKGKVFVNGGPVVTKGYRLKNGDRIYLNVVKQEEMKILPEPIPIDIIWEDNDIMIVNKPKGMVVHPASGVTSGTLVNALLHHCDSNLSTINGNLRPGIVHRIDKDTGGLLMIAKNDKTHVSLARQLEERRVLRVYRLIVHNNLKEDKGTINAPIARDPNNRLRMAVVCGGREAITHYKVLDRFGDYSYLEAELETGRTHQIRVHMAHIKHPIVGDSLYGPKKQALGAGSQMLHSRKLGFIHPVSGVYMEFESPLPEEFQTIIRKIKNRSGR
ncbi:MAG: RluA family pseudouridine synthase [Anaerovoracaceae bacterium]|jgi:23S rRNA pseudouridine1911/1915/1917 synthase